MPRRGQRKRRTPAPTQPGDMRWHLHEFLAWLRTRNYSEQTIANRDLYLGYFIDWCAQRSLTKPGEITKPILERYQRHLYHYRKTNGRPLSFQSQHSRLVPVRALFKWLTRQNHILYNPASELVLPRVSQRIPKYVLTANEAERVLAQTEVSNPLGVRDRAILETFYSTGIRRMELIALTLYCIDTERETLMIRQGKGSKDRLVPIGSRAMKWLDKYLVEVRPTLVVEPDEGELFLTNLGEPFTPNRMTQLVRDYVDAAALNKRGSCHLFRHTMATLMLENGADIRFIQAMLGHTSLSTTQLYTQVSIHKLKEIHTLSHPARLRGPAPAARPVAEQALLDALAAEAFDEEEEAAIEGD